MKIGERSEIVLDDSLRQMADRIQARAVRRMGELLKQFDGSTRNKGKEGALLTSRTEMADSVGVSEHQRKQAIRVANVPTETFEAAIEQQRGLRRAFTSR